MLATSSSTPAGSRISSRIMLSISSIGTNQGLAMAVSCVSSRGRRETEEVRGNCSESW